MKKFVITKTGEEVAVGKPLKVTITNGCFVHHIYENPCTQETLNDLIKSGVVKAVEENAKKAPKASDSILYYVDKLATKLHLTYVECCKMIARLTEYSPMTALSLLSKQISLELDKQYEGHIRDAEHVYILSSVTGTISELPKSLRENTNYRNFTAFRTKEDAAFALHVLAGLYKSAFADDAK